mgnify:CR=1 FL=1
MIKGVIFDFDGVIVDSEPLRYESYKKLFWDEFGVKLPDERKRILGRDQRENLKYLLEMFGLECDVEELVERRKIILKEIFSKKENIIPIDGILDFLETLKKKRIKMAVASSSSLEYLENICDGLKIKDYFDCILSGEMVKKKKPNPDIFLLALEKLGLEKEECVVIEDSLSGIEAAKRAGIKCSGITSTLSEDELEDADFVFQDFEQDSIFKKFIF